MSRFLAAVALIFCAAAVTSFALAVTFFIRAIWTVGDNAGRWGGTGAVFLALSVILGFATAMTFLAATDDYR